MLRKIREEEIDQYIDFAYELSLDRRKSAYPLYSDGIKTKDDFVSLVKDGFKREGEEVYLFLYEGEVEGLIQFYVEHEDKYIQTVAINVNKGMKLAINELIELISSMGLSGYEAYFGFPAENEEAIEACRDAGLELVEECVNTAMFLDEVEPAPATREVLPVTRENFDDFRLIHKKAEEDMYWTSDRILECLQNWSIFMCREKGKMVGAVYTMNETILEEIFGVDFIEGSFSREAYMSLLSTAAKDCKERGIKYLCFFSEKEQREETIEVGFKELGEYKCFRKVF